MYDYVIVTHLPSFYKVNLYNEIAKKLNLFVIFIASSSKERNADFTKSVINFEYKIINNKNYENRNFIFSCIKLFLVIRKIKYKKVIVSGWDLSEFWMTILLNSKKKNCLALESNILGTKLNFYYYFIKKFFLSQVSIVFASGILHSLVPKKLNFKGKIYITNGVGIINKINYPPLKRTFRNKFLYVGRLAKEKNLETLIDVFCLLPQLTLTIVGSGPLKDDLKKKASQNIIFMDHIKNQSLHEIYLEHDVFILPSTSEPWGIVIDEALYYGMPIIASSSVGSYPELIESGNCGLIFNPKSKHDLENKIKSICQENNFNLYLENVRKFDIKLKDLYQVQKYFEASI